MTITKTTTIEYQFTSPATLKDLREFMEEVSNFSDDVKVAFIVSEPVIDYHDGPSGRPATVKITLTQNGPLPAKQPRHIVGLGTFDK